jgi:hypothetical protein
MGAVGDLQLAANVGNVVLDCLQTDRELAGYFSIAASLSDQAQHLALAVGQFGKDWRGRESSGEESDQSPCDRRAEDCLAIGDRRTARSISGLGAPLRT